MLRIRPEQMAVFDEQFRLKFEQRIMNLLRENVPEVNSNYPPATHAKMVHEAVDTAQEFGYNVEADVFQMVVFHFALGPGYLKKPQYRWIAETLRDQKTEPHVRLLHVRTRLEEEAAKAV